MRVDTDLWDVYVGEQRCVGMCWCWRGVSGYIHACVYLHVYEVELEGRSVPGYIHAYVYLHVFGVELEEVS